MFVYLTRHSDTVYRTEQQLQDSCFVLCCTCGRGQLKCDGTTAETRFRLSAQGTSPFKSAGASIQSNTGSRGLRISGSNAGYTMFRGSVKSTSYPHPFTSPPVRHRVPSHFNWSLPSDVRLGPQRLPKYQNDCLNVHIWLHAVCKCLISLKTSVQAMCCR
jgi:hypothetical protein